MKTEWLNKTEASLLQDVMRWSMHAYGYGHKDTPLLLRKKRANTRKTKKIISALKMSESGRNFPLKYRNDGSDLYFILTNLQMYAENFKDDSQNYMQPAFSASKLYRKLQNRIPQESSVSIR